MVNEESITSNFKSGSESSENLGVPSKEKKETKPEKYTREFVIGELKEMLGELRGNKKIVYLGELFENRDYSRQRFSEWEKKFKEDNEISDTIVRIQDILETRVNVGGLKNELNASMTKFNLINNYDWKDKNETDLTSGGKPLPIYGGISRHPSDKEDIQPKEEN